MNGINVTAVIPGLVIAFFLGAGSSIVLAHGGGQMRGSGYGMDYGMGSMRMMGGPGMAGFGHMHHEHHGPMMGGTGVMGMGPGMTGAPGMMGGMGIGPIWMLDLSDEQRTKIHTIQHELHKAHWNIMGNIMDEQSELHQLFAGEERDAKAIGAVYGKIFDYKQQMIEGKIEAMNRMQAVLTEEQREHLKQMRRGMGGPKHHGSMGHGGMMGSGGGTGG